MTGEAPILDVGTTNNSTGMQANLIEQMPVIVAGTQRAITDYLQRTAGLYVGRIIYATGERIAGWATPRHTSTEARPANGALLEVESAKSRHRLSKWERCSVVQNAFNAEYGGFGSWFTNVVLKSGTNELHGSVYDHLGNSALERQVVLCDGSHAVSGKTRAASPLADQSYCRRSTTGATRHSSSEALACSILAWAPAARS